MRLGLRAALCSAALVASALGGPAEAKGWQCVTFARAFSGIQLFGNAHSWWRKAIGKYAEGAVPKIGSVLVFKAIDSMRYGHVATVTKVVSDRVIKVTHANWSPIHGRRGQVERNVTVMDTSPDNDWSQVKVWYAPLKHLGTRHYPTYGFIYGDRHGEQLASSTAGHAAKTRPVAPPIRGFEVVSRTTDSEAG